MHTVSSNNPDAQGPNLLIEVFGSPLADEDTVDVVLDGVMYGFMTQIDGEEQQLACVAQVYFFASRFAPPDIVGMVRAWLDANFDVAAMSTNAHVIRLVTESLGSVAWASERFYKAANYIFPGGIPLDAGAAHDMRRSLLEILTYTFEPHSPEQHRLLNSGLFDRLLLEAATKAPMVNAVVMQTTIPCDEGAAAEAIARINASYDDLVLAARTRIHRQRLSLLQVYDVAFAAHGGIPPAAAAAAPPPGRLLAGLGRMVALRRICRGSSHNPGQKVEPFGIAVALFL